MRGLNCSQIEVDELWGFCGKKQVHTSQAERRAGLGDVWTFLSIDPMTKVMPSFLVGKRATIITPFNSWKIWPGD
jgi:hypothetical protein